MRSFLLLLLLLCSSAMFGQKYYLFVGTYTSNGSKGIYVYNFDASTGKATWVSNTEGLVNPSYLAISPDQKFVYAVTETATPNAGSVSAFSFNKQSGKLTFINKQPSGGDNPCYVAVHKRGKWVVVGNYSGGSLSAFPINKDGSLQPFAQNIQHSGSSINKQRQEKAHVHSTVFSPNEKYLFAPDLGLDKIMIYRFNATAQKPLTSAAPAFANVEGGNGPRHFVFHPNKKLAYLMEEMSGTVTVFGYRKGALTFLQRISSHPANFTGATGSADIHLSPDGRFLYASSRGDANNITSFKVNDDGTLTALAFDSTLGKTPRNFIIDPTGNYVLVANQNSNNIVIFKRDNTTGALTPTGEEMKVPTPVCLQMMKR
jgi:6-phosphogluconolactonase